MSAVHRNNDESTFDERRPAGGNSDCIRPNLRSHDGRPKGGDFFYGSFMDDNILETARRCSSEVAVFVLRHHTHMIANQDGSVYSTTRCSAA